MFKEIVGTISTVLDRVIPDKNARERAEHELKKLDQSGDLQKMMGQLEVNKVEAAHPSIFVSGWRPFIGWVCGAALVYNYIVYNFLLWGMVVFKAKVAPPPAMELETLLPVLFGMLGMGGLRTFEKMKKVSRNNMKG